MTARYRSAVAALLSLLGACTASSAVEPSCDADSRKYSASWAELSDAQLLEEAGRACGRVFVGFKEADAWAGVDAHGRVLTDPSTVTRMKAYLRERGITLEVEYDLPAVAARMPLRLELVKELRTNPNVDYLEPIFPGTRYSRL